MNGLRMIRQSGRRKQHPYGILADARTERGLSGCSMERRGSQTLVLTLLIVAPIVLIALAYAIGYLLQPRPVFVPKVEFLETTSPAARFTSAFGESIPDEVGAESEATRSMFPILVVGDYGNPRVISRDFHVIPDGYRAVDHTRKRVLTLNREMEVVAVLDRSASVPSGLWQSIDACRVDTSGNTYLLDKRAGLVQVIDSAGDYLRRHRDLGLDLFGSPLNPQNILLDKMDRLWIVGGDRIFVVDRFGNLERIFEKRGAPYVRTTPTGPPVPPEHTSRGYTILPSTDPFSPRRDPTQPVVLDVGEYDSFALGGAADPELMYLGQSSTDQVVVFHWSGRERGTIDLAALVPSADRQFAVGPDGYVYLIDPENETVQVLDPLGEPVATIEVDGLPQDGWQPLTPPIAPGRSLGRPPAPVRCMIDFDGRLVVFDAKSSEVIVFPLRVTE
jgi:hypothetical protein